MADAAAREAGSYDRQYLTLLELSKAVASHRELPDIVNELAGRLRDFFDFRYFVVMLHDAARDALVTLVAESGDPLGPRFPDEIPVEGSMAGWVFREQRPYVDGQIHARLARFPVAARLLGDSAVHSVCFVPLTTAHHRLGVLAIASRRPDAFSERDVELLDQIGKQVAIAVENALAFREIDALKTRLETEKHYLEEEIRTENNFEEIVGRSKILRRVLQAVETVAPTNSTVLILGETGTGKELLARAIHNLSSRRERTLVKVNCAAIPTGLLESELFGHERGAFTGAIERRVGRFELADRGISSSTRSRTSRRSCSRSCCACSRSRSSSGSGARERCGSTRAWSRRRTWTSPGSSPRSASEATSSTG
jgi:formate hydrogenlyase transcriptional activator